MTDELQGQQVQGNASGENLNCNHAVCGPSEEGTILQQVPEYCNYGASTEISWWQVLSEQEKVLFFI